MRHAKSDWSADYGADHDRPLNERGLRSARIMGETLASEGHVPDHVITSSAERARHTAQLAAEAGHWDLEITVDSRLYEAGVDAAIAVASEAPPVRSVMLVGHQPTWSRLVATLTGEQAEMKTATVAIIDFEMTDWADLSSTSGALCAVYQPRDLLGGV
jgi:phosphohistidine phosphatase